MNGPLDFETNPILLVEIRGTDSVTGNSATVLFAVLVGDDPSDNVGTPPSARPYTADTVVTEIESRKIVPTRFGDLPKVMQNSLNAGRPIYFREGAGKWFTTSPTTPKGNVIVVRGPYPADTQHGQWETKLNEAENKYARFELYNAFHIKATFKKLKAATREMEFSPLPLETFHPFGIEANAEYQYRIDQMALPFGQKIPALEVHTVLHESIHVLDRKSAGGAGWYLHALSSNDENAEALAYGFQHTWSMLDDFVDIENYLKKPDPDPATDNKRLQEKWYSLALKLQNMFAVNIVKWPGNQRWFTPADVTDLKTKVGFRLNVSGVAGIYAAMAAAQGLSYSFPLTGIAGYLPTDPLKNMPAVFVAP